jgi:hypothetical protein
VLCSGLLVLAQAGLGYLCLGKATVPWYWLAGTPIAFFLICGLVAFGITSGLGAAYARRQGLRVGLLAGISGALVALVITGPFVLWALTTPPPPSTTQLDRLPLPSQALLLFVVFAFLIVSVAVNLVGVALASLGGLVGGQLRALLTPTDPTVPVQPGEREHTGPSTGTILIVVLCVVLGVLAAAGAIFLPVGC